MPDDYTPERWVYMGRRLGRDEKVSHVFEDERGNDLWFGKAPPHAVVGYVYEVSVKRDGDGVTALLKRATRLDRATERDDAISEWRIMDAAAETRHQAELASRRLAKEGRDLSDLTLGELRATMSKQLPHMRRGTLAVVHDFLVRA